MSSGKDVCEISIATKGGPIPMEDFSDFLYHFRAAYAAALRHGIRDTSQIGRSSDLRLSPPGFSTSLLRWDELSRLASDDLAQDSLDIIDIRRSNPIALVLSGVIGAVAAAAIFSGGTIEISGILKAELPPLGTGIAAIREALGMKPKRRRRKAKTLPSDIHE